VNTLRISVPSSGSLLLDGRAVALLDLKAALEQADRATDCVLYYRENAAAEAPPESMEVMKLIIENKLPVSLSSKPDFSDYVDRFGQFHPRPTDVPEMLQRDPFAPHMPDVDLRPAAEELFANARKLASGESGNPGIVMVSPDRRLLLLPLPPPSARTARMAKGLRKIIPSDRGRNIAVIGNTGFTMSSGPGAPSVEEASRAIPFLGFLAGFCYAGHKIWIFEGHPSALAAGLAESEVLLLDSAMLPFLQSDWMQVAQRVMHTDRRVFIHKREGYQLLPVVQCGKAPGWCYSEPDGEASYVNCLLTTLAKGSVPSVEIVTGAPVPHLAGLASDPDELDWIASLPFKYEALSAGMVIFTLLCSTGGLKNWFRREWTHTMKLALENEESRDQTFVFRLQRRWVKPVLQISKRDG
jgi:hypothetical protein